MTTTIAPELEPEPAETEERQTPEPHVADPVREEPGAHAFDATQGRQIGSEPYDDATQGRQIGSEPYDDATRAR